MNYISAAFGWLANSAEWRGSTGIPTRLAQHLITTGIVVGLALVISLPIGILVGHTHRGAGVVGAVAGAARAIPTLGLLTLFGLMWGIGLKAPILALVILAIPSALAGAYAGIQAIDPAVSDAARAIGMSELRIILQVEIPLGAPVIIGGIRAATLQVVATATLAAYIADNGLGRYLFHGLEAHNYAEMLGGAMLVIALALILEVVLAAIQRWVKLRVTNPRSSRRQQLHI
ncbi:MAG: ABC transporter permease [Propionibacteriaceae bacterium]|nr:ABC transporter permease [Propionibacteriaceae bacterium]